MAHDHEYPELVTQRAHGPGMPQDASFEDALRDLVRNSPYLVVSLVLHGAVLAALYFMKEEIPIEDPSKKIVASMDKIEEPLPPEPPPEPEIEEIDEIIEDPVITEDFVEISEVVDSQVDSEFDSNRFNDVIGAGGGAAGTFGGRGGKLKNRGKAAGEAYQRGVDDALKWLWAHQHPDGYWDADAYDDECGKIGEDGYCIGRGSPRHDIGVTGLALLAFLGAGNTDKEGRYKDTVKSCLRYLLDVQDRDGNFADPSVSLHTYDHMIATLAVTEAYALTKKHQYKKSAQKAIDYMYSVRVSPDRAWRYGDPGDPEMIAEPEDTSVTGWAIMILTLAKEYGIDYDQAAMDNAMAFIDEVTDKATGETSYFRGSLGCSRPPGAEATWRGDQTESMTAVGVLCRIFTDPNFEKPETEDLVNKGVDRMLKLPIVWSDDENLIGRRDFYYWYYASYAIYQVGGTPWKRWEKGIEDLAGAQVEEGEMKGSWDPEVDPWGGEGGRVYATAINALTLEVFYRYDSVIGQH